MNIIVYNGFNGFYVVTKDESVFDGLRFHFWAETIKECEVWVNSNKRDKQTSLNLPTVTE